MLLLISNYEKKSDRINKRLGQEGSHETKQYWLKMYIFVNMVTIS